MQPVKARPDVLVRSLDEDVVRVVKGMLNPGPDVDLHDLVIIAKEKRRFGQPRVFRFISGGPDEDEVCTCCNGTGDKQ